MSDASTLSTPRTCRCGHGRDHFMVSPHGSYSWMGYVWLCMGVTAYPRRVRFQCRACNQVFDSTTDPEECKKYR